MQIVDFCPADQIIYVKLNVWLLRLKIHCNYPMAIELSILWTGRLIWTLYFKASLQSLPPCVLLPQPNYTAKLLCLHWTHALLLHTWTVLNMQRVRFTDYCILDYYLFKDWTFPLIFVLFTNNLVVQLVGTFWFLQHKKKGSEKESINLNRTLQFLFNSNFKRSNIVNESFCTKLLSSQTTMII